MMLTKIEHARQTLYKEAVARQVKENIARQSVIVQQNVGQSVQQQLRNLVNIQQQIRHPVNLQRTIRHPVIRQHPVRHQVSVEQQIRDIRHPVNPHHLVRQAQVVRQPDPGARSARFVVPEHQVVGPHPTLTQSVSNSFITAMGNLHTPQVKDILIKSCDLGSVADPVLAEFRIQGSVPLTIEDF